MHKAKGAITIQTYANQKSVIVQPEKNAPEKIYGRLTREAEKIAAKLLNDGTASHILFLHLALNQDNYKLALSPKALENELGISKKQYNKAVKRLIDTGYLVLLHGNTYAFYRIPTEMLPRKDIASSPTGSEDSPPEGGSIPPQRDREIIQDKINNTDILFDDLSFITDVGKDKDIVSNDNDCFLFDDDTVSKSTDFLPERTTDVSQEHVTNLRTDWKALCKSKAANRFKSTVDYLKSQRILKKYFKDNTEGFEKSLGDMYGRFILGWDNEKQQPIIGYTTVPILPHENIDAVPKEYYTK